MILPNNNSSYSHVSIKFAGRLETFTAWRVLHPLVILGSLCSGRSFQLIQHNDHGELLYQGLVCFPCSSCFSRSLNIQQSVLIITSPPTFSCSQACLTPALVYLLPSPHGQTGPESGHLETQYTTAKFSGVWNCFHFLPSFLSRTSVSFPPYHSLKLLQQDMWQHPQWSVQ